MIDRKFDDMLSYVQYLKLCMNLSSAVLCPMHLLSFYYPHLSDLLFLSDDANYMEM